jgi:hypothetical protein
MNKQYLDGESNNVYPYWNDSIGSIQCMWYGKQMERREFVEEPRRPENAQAGLQIPRRDFC